jgi:arylsulfatase
VSLDGGQGPSDAGPSQDASATDAGTVRTDPRPNIVIVLADDMGFSDVGTYGGEIQTPNIDALAANGLRFTNFYNGSRCSPSRAALLTGQYPKRVNVPNNGTDLGLNGWTMAEALGSAGYNTAMAGKWHLSEMRKLPNGLLPDAGDGGAQKAWYAHQFDPGLPFATRIETYPAGRGFQHHFGTIGGPVDYFDPFSLVEDFAQVRAVSPDFYVTNAFGDKAVQFVESFAASDKPFFLYVAHHAPHAPLHALPTDIDKYKDQYKDGWAPVRKARYERQMALGLFDRATTPLPVNQQGANWAALSASQQAFQTHSMQAHAAQVDRMDQTVGALVDALKRTGQYENTLLLFLSDNGASNELGPSEGDHVYETRDGRPVQYCEGGPTADCPYSQPGPETTFAAIGQAWANVANTPFRYWKVEGFRGGTSTPLIVHWPKGLRTSSANAITPQVGHIIDVLPTLLEVANVKYPATYNGRTLTPLDGQSLKFLIDGGAARPRGPLYFALENGASMISGDYKIVRLNVSGAAWELYNLKNDRTETTNLATSEPMVLSTMVSQWQAWFDSL